MKKPASLAIDRNAWTAERVPYEKDGAAVNPWAACTASTGREDKAKYERCVHDIKAKSPIKKD